MATKKKTEKQKTQAIAEELRDWMQNFDRPAPDSFPVLVCRLLASMQGGERMEDIGYEPFELGWVEADMIGRMLVTIQGKMDVEEIVNVILGEDEEEDLGEKKTMPAGRNLNVAQGTVRTSRRKK